MYYYKLVDENGNPYGVMSSGEPHPNPPDNCIQITYEEYLEICELCGFEPK